MYRFITLYIYAIIVLIGIIYDLFIAKFYFFLYDKTNSLSTAVKVSETIVFGLLIFLSKYYNYNILPWILVVILAFFLILNIALDQNRISQETNRSLIFDKREP